jgi:phosphinothricin acetyltransferase
MIRNAQPRDADVLAELYNHYVINTVATFEEEPVTAHEMKRRLDAVNAVGLPWLILERDGEACGYAYADRWKSRAACRCSVESTIYLDVQAIGNGLGNQLCGRLLEDLQQLDVHTVLAGIALPNNPSVRLHERLGFEKVGHMGEVGCKFDRWIDVGYWQRMFTSHTTDAEE